MSSVPLAPATAPPDSAWLATVQDIPTFKTPPPTHIATFLFSAILTMALCGILMIVLDRSRRRK